MSTESKILVQRWFEEVWNQKRESAIDELAAPNCTIHGVAPEPVRGPEAFKAYWRGLLQAFPDIRVAVEATVQEGEKVAARCSVRATHAGDGLGLKATNRPVSFTGMCIAHVRDGQLCEGWNNFDFLTLYQQLGVVPELGK